VEQRDLQIAQLKIAVEHRTTIGVAVGLLMGHHRLATPDEAFALLRKAASHWEPKVYDIAMDLAARRLDPNDLAVHSRLHAPAARRLPAYLERLLLEEPDDDEQPAAG